MELLPMVDAVLDLKELWSYSAVLETLENAHYFQETLKDLDHEARLNFISLKIP